MRIPSFAIGAIAEHAGAQKRRHIDIVVVVRQMKTKSRVCDGELGVATVDVVAGELRAIAKIFPIRSTIDAIAVGPTEPGNTDAITDSEWWIADGGLGHRHLVCGAG